MDILHEKKVETFVLVSSDSDFTSLAMRIREEGFRVVGIGRKTTPPASVKACDQFVHIETLTGDFVSEIPVASKSDARKETNDLHNKGRELLITAAKMAMNESGIIRGGANLGTMLRRMDPSFDPRTYGVKRLTDFVALHHDILIPTGKRADDGPVYQVSDKILGNKITS